MINREQLLVIDKRYGGARGDRGRKDYPASQARAAHRRREGKTPHTLKVVASHTAEMAGVAMHS